MQEEAAEKGNCSEEAAEGGNEVRGVVRRGGAEGGSRGRQQEKVAREGKKGVVREGGQESRGEGTAKEKEQ